MRKYAPQGIVAQAFSHVNYDAANLGDLVCITGDMQVNSVAGRCIGRISAKDSVRQTVAVEFTPCVQMLDATVGVGGVTAGKYVKMSGLNTIVTANPDTVPGDIILACGIAVNTVAATGTATFIAF